jgi:hypothetical protein
MKTAKQTKTGEVGNEPRVQIEHFFQAANFFRVPGVQHGDRLHIGGYLGYFAFGSVAGYALENFESPEEAINRAKENRHQQVWVNALCSIIDCSGRTAQEKAMSGAPAGSKVHYLGFGSLVWFEGQLYELIKAPNQNVALNPVTMFLDGTVEGRKHIDPADRVLEPETTRELDEQERYGI